MAVHSCACWVSFANLSWEPTDNTALANALWDKADVSSLATVATSWDYDDLLNKPTIPSAQIQNDWTQADNTKKDYIKNKPTLSAVATSGSYNDLSNKPTIPTVNDNTITITQGGVTKGSFTLNQNTNATIDNILIFLLCSIYIITYLYTIIIKHIKKPLNVLTQLEKQQRRHTKCFC